MNEKIRHEEEQLAPVTKRNSDNNDGQMSEGASFSDEELQVLNEYELDVKKLSEICSVTEILLGDGENGYVGVDLDFNGDLRVMCGSYCAYNDDAADDIDELCEIYAETSDPYRTWTLFGHDVGVCGDTDF